VAWPVPLTRFDLVHVGASVDHLVHWYVTHRPSIECPCGFVILGKWQNTIKSCKMRN
jgi:hypothetical protein